MGDFTLRKLLYLFCIGTLSVSVMNTCSASSKAETEKLAEAESSKEETEPQSKDGVFAYIHESSAVFSPHAETDELTIQLNNSVSDILFSKSKRIKYSQYLNFHYF